MDSSILLDYALFQLTPTRTRCDLILFHGGKTEKLASGLFEPFVSHLKFAKEQISKGGYSIKLCPPSKTAPWFSKSTFERFVRFVSTPAVIERFVSLEREISQIKSSVQSNAPLNTGVVGHAEEGSGVAPCNNTIQSRETSKLKGEPGRSIDTVTEENSKIQLQRLLETRKSFLRKEQAMAYARGVVAGFDVNNIDDLISFADAFGASRLRLDFAKYFHTCDNSGCWEACVNFKDLCKKKHGDGLWMEELKAVEACPPSDLSILGTSGILLANEISTFNQNAMLNCDGLSLSDSTATHSSSESKKGDNLATSDQMQSATAKVQVPMWPNQIPQYMYAYPVQKLPSYQGYPYPVQPIPPHYPQWPYGVKESSPAKKEKPLNRKGHQYSGEDKQTESSEFEVSVDSDTHPDRGHSSMDAPGRRKPRKKSSKTIVIRNINYITPDRRNGEKGGDSDEPFSNEDEFIDGGSLKQKVEDAVGPFDELHQSNSRTTKKKGSLGHNHIANGSADALDQDTDNVLSMASRGIRTSEGWDAFQNLLMRDEAATSSGVERLHVEGLRDEHFTVRSSEEEISSATNHAVELELDKEPKRRMGVGDSFFVIQRDAVHEDRERPGDNENALNCRPVVKKRDSIDKDLIISRRSEDSGSGLGSARSSYVTESSKTKPGSTEDWFLINHPEKPKTTDATYDQTTFNGNGMLSYEAHCLNTGKSKKEELVDDSFKVQALSTADDLYDSQWKTDISIAEDVTLYFKAEKVTSENSNGTVNACEPNDLCVVLERDSTFDFARESWSTDQGIDISSMEANRKSLSVENDDHAGKKSPNSNTTILKKNESNRSKIQVKEARSKVLNGSTGKSRNQMISRSKKSPLASRPSVQKSKLEKEEEMRKSMEKMMIQRQKRIAERTAAAGLAPAGTKKVPMKGTINSERTRTQETNRIISVKIRAA